MKALKKKEFEFKEAIQTWAKLSPPLAPLRNERQYKRAVAFLDYLIDEVRSNEKHRLAPLLELVGVLIENYETERVAELRTSSIIVLKMLMEEHSLTQKDMRKELGSQGVASEILNGNRKLNVRQIKALSKKFHVSPAVFLD